MTCAEIIDFLRLCFSNCNCCVPVNATPAPEIILDIGFINATPESNPVFKNVYTDSAYVPRGLDPVVANVINTEGNSSC